MDRSGGEDQLEVVRDIVAVLVHIHAALASFVDTRIVLHVCAREDEVLTLRDREPHADRIDVGQHIEHDRVWITPNEFAGLRLRQADQAADWRIDLRVAQVDLGQIHACLGGLHAGPGRRLLSDGRVEVLLADRLHLGQRPDPVQVGIGFRQGGLGACQLAHRLDQLGLEWFGIDRIQKVTLIDEAAFAEIHRLQEALYAGADRHILRPERRADHLQKQGHIAPLGVDHLDRERRRQGDLVFAAAAA